MIIEEGNILEFSRVQADVQTGLNAQQVQQRISAGACNWQPQSTTRTVPQIILKNVCTLFNLINLVLAVAIILVGRIENTLFFGVVICNTVIGIVQELRSKRKLDQLVILSQAKVAVVRDGAGHKIDQSQVVMDEIIYLETGTQICADAVVVQTAGMEVDESLLTGEGNNIPKKAGDRVDVRQLCNSGQGLCACHGCGQRKLCNRPNH